MVDSPHGAAALRAGAAMLLPPAFSIALMPPAGQKYQRSNLAEPGGGRGQPDQRGNSRLFRRINRRSGATELDSAGDRMARRQLKRAPRSEDASPRAAFPAENDRGGRLGEAALDAMRFLDKCAQHSSAQPSAAAASAPSSSSASSSSSFQPSSPRQPPMQVNLEKFLAGGRSADARHFWPSAAASPSLPMGGCRYDPRGLPPASAAHRRGRSPRSHASDAGFIITPPAASRLPAVTRCSGITLPWISRRAALPVAAGTPPATPSPRRTSTPPSPRIIGQPA